MFEPPKYAVFKMKFDQQIVDASKNLNLPVTGSTCVDERTTYTAPAVFGGDWGILIVLYLALLPTTPIEELFTHLLNAYHKDNAKFYVHTDDHGHSANHIGCGFTKVVVNRTIPNNPEFAENIANLYSKIVSKEFTHPALFLDTLKGEHNASGVVVISRQNPKFSPYHHIGRTVTLSVEVHNAQASGAQNAQESIKDVQFKVFVNNLKTQDLLVEIFINVLKDKLFITQDTLAQAIDKVSKTLKTYIDYTLEDLTATPEYKLSKDTTSIQKIPEDQRKPVPVKELPTWVV